MNAVKHWILCGKLLQNTRNDRIWITDTLHAVYNPQHIYRKISNIRRTKSPNLNVPRLVLQMSLPNPMKLGAKSRMEM